jgi:hypothetical protein
MSIVRIALAASALVAGVATAVVAQTTPTPAPTDPNTKVYAYKKTAPQPANPSQSEYAGAMPSQTGQADQDVPRYGTRQWWEEKNRYGQGSGD